MILLEMRSLPIIFSNFIHQYYGYKDWSHLSFRHPDPLWTPVCRSGKRAVHSEHLLELRALCLQYLYI